jgi:hypothetical protein
LRVVARELESVVYFLSGVYCSSSSSICATAQTLCTLQPLLQCGTS